VMLSLYAYAFGSYGASLFPATVETLWKHLLISASLVVITVLNLFSARLIGEAVPADRQILARSLGARHHAV
jgi:amino acid transporter